MLKTSAAHIRRCISSFPGCLRTYHIQQNVGSSKVAFHLTRVDQKDSDTPLFEMDSSRLGYDQTGLLDGGNKPPSQSLAGEWMERCRTQIRKSFLPHGYPHSVGEGYVSYVSWIACGSLFSSAAGVLATQALLASVGVGDQTAKVASAGINWVLKDGLGSLGNILVASKLGNRFDLYPKRWSFRSNIMLQVGIGLEIMTLLLPHLFLPLGATANLMKGLAWSAGGASRAAIHFSFSKMMNMGDITAKATSQLIASNMVGLWMGLLISSFIGNAFVPSLQAYFVLGGLHLFSVSRALQHVRLCSLNPERMGFLVNSYVSGESVPTPDLMQNRESFMKIPLPAIDKGPAHAQLRIGSQVDRIAQTPSQLASLIELFEQDHYILGMRRNTLHLVFHEKAQTPDLLAASLHAGKMKQLLSCATLPEDTDARWTQIRSMIAQSKQYTLENTENFRQSLQEKGWNTSAVFLEVRSQRATWSKNG